MDDRSLVEATDRWVKAGVIDQETAEAIRTYEADRDGDGPWGFTTVLAAMGASLVGAGVLVYLAANWQTLPVWLRTAILLVVPVAFASTGLLLDRRQLPRAGTGTWILGAVSVGPSLYLLADLHAPAIAVAWPLLLWGVIALPMGHAFRSRLATGVGLVALFWAVLASGEGDTGFVLIGLLTTLVIAAVILVRDRAPTLTDTYRGIGIATLIGVFLWLNTFEGQFDAIAVETGAGLSGALVLAVGVAVVAIMLWQRGGARRGDALLVTVPPVAMLFLLGIIGTFEPLPVMVGYFAVQFLLLLVLLAVVLLALLLGSTVLVNLVFVGFFVQILSILATVTGELSGAVALIIIGIVLVIVAIGLERGRRQIVDRLSESE